ncbi:unnamed protein product [Caenorhabditis angaria]|uniref:ZP domain-containing protein n=1 Tax=Caenorhabditis angaria TaxID=860376 RepID=A0A9P1IL86_9PELO|nr:unnamed protein product [Caenorhabditis angaria]
MIIRNIIIIDLWIFLIFCKNTTVDLSEIEEDCSSSKDVDSFCPSFPDPISNQSFGENINSVCDVRNSTIFNKCLFPSFSCVRIQVSLDLYIFGCMEVDQRGSVRPVVFESDNSIKTDDTNSIAVSKSCPEKRPNNSNTFQTMVTFENRSFLSNISCCYINCTRNYSFDVTSFLEQNEPKHGLHAVFRTPIVQSIITALLIIICSCHIYEKLKQRMTMKALLKLRHRRKKKRDEFASESDKTQTEKEKKSIVPKCFRRKKDLTKKDKEKGFEFLLPHKQV